MRRVGYITRRKDNRLRAKALQLHPRNVKKRLQVVWSDEIKKWWKLTESLNEYSIRQFK